MLKTQRNATDINTEPIHERVTRLRQESGFTQIEIAEQLGITQSDVSAYERGARRFHSEIIAIYAQVLSVTADELVGLNPPEKGAKIGVHLTKRMQKLQQLPKAKQKVLLQTIDLFLKGAEK